MLPGSSCRLEVEVTKKFLLASDFGYANEKGFDLAGSAMWTNETPPMVAPPGDFGVPSPTLTVTEGMLTIVPMPDFSMRFNVLALTSTVVTVFLTFLLEVHCKQNAAVDRPPPTTGMKLGLVVLRSVASFTCLVCFLYHEKIMVGGVEEVMYVGPYLKPIRDKIWPYLEPHVQGALSSVTPALKPLLKKLHR